MIKNQLTIALAADRYEWKLQNNFLRWNDPANHRGNKFLKNVKKPKETSH